MADRTDTQETTEVNEADKRNGQDEATGESPSGTDINSRDREHSAPPETDVELRSALKQVEKWEKSQKKLAIWDRITRLPFKVLDKLTPKIVHEKIGQLLDELGNYVQHGGKYLVARRKVDELLRKLDGGDGDGKRGAYPLSVMDKAAERLSKSSRNTATAQGATTGVGGVFTLAADIPAVLGLSLKAIQEIGLCYGYDPNEKIERVFAVKVLQFSASDVVGKQAVLDELNLKVGEDGRLPSSASALSKLQGWREVMTAYRDTWGWKKLLQAVPVAGIFFGAFTNRQTLDGVTEAAGMLYRKRRILERLEKLESAGKN
ncbi:EcsC family protein [Saccharibacillus sp. CPCC 101409]|uniref:EcsC family protein n=1 Tax=Saccharibacillus sp. CPCC 101409 TaxID=3058041 RepID=UPI0026736EFE|nr:EcsC family protein [Saccharibacillus sp. CPCC 101409]MDO3409933.1 EcsC family protein [Saccharibacillus sp. CPCC 101409]